MNTFEAESSPGRIDKISIGVFDSAARLKVDWSTCPIVLYDMMITTNSHRPCTEDGLDSSFFDYTFSFASLAEIF